MMLSELLPTPIDRDIEVSGITDDSRNVQPGDVFFAVLGQAVDGRHYLTDAIKRGANAVVLEDGGQFDTMRAELGENVSFYQVPDLKQALGSIASKFFGDPSQGLRVIAVTGTNGKTSFTHLLSDALSGQGRRCGMIGTMGHGLPGTLVEPGLTTPASIVLHRKLRALIDLGCDTVALEASSHGLAQSRLSGVKVDVAVLTNITRDHLDYHGTFEAYRAAKKTLFLLDSLRAVVVNLDDDFSSELIKSLDPDVAVFTYSAKGAANVQLVSVKRHAEGLGLSLLLQENEVVDVDVPLLGSFNIENLLAVSATLLALDYACEEVKPMLEAVRAVPGRMELVGRPNQPKVVVDYAHTPDALEKALRATREHFPDRHVCCVFGCGGDRDIGKRALMGEVVSRLADKVIVTNDNPRSESPEEIARQILSGITEQSAWTILDRRSAIFTALAHAANDDVVLIAGKGHEDYQVTDGVTVPFSDSAVVESAFEGSIQKSMVLGLGETGLSFARHLIAHDVQFGVADDHPAAKNIARLDTLAPGSNVQSLIDAGLTRAQTIYLSPGIPLTALPVHDARLAGVPVRGDIELFGELANAPIAAITGTNGKSTVAQMVFELAVAQWEGVYLGGNIGTPCLDILSEDASLYVLEVSSYQLELAQRLPTKTATVLNLSPDHLDRYQSLDDYYETKLALYRHCEMPVVNRNLTRRAALDLNVPFISFGLDECTGTSAFGLVGTTDDRYLTFNGKSVLLASALKLKGDHNIENGLAALAMGHALGLDVDQMLKTLSSFEGLPHRGEWVKEVGGVEYINDSKATNPGAMTSSVAGFANGRNVILIAGGDSKGLEFSQAAAKLEGYVKAVFVIGVETAEFSAAFSSFDMTVAGVLDLAFQLAVSQAEPGDIVLLSPGCASQDQYLNFAARGDAFKSLVGALRE
ncbi:MAG: UDP-N-acetylmuramoyl-L-alanyl-D-glutamate--2,6-diaminopimelate ligase [Candidatus Azotimanducaceae bacterium]|jgi:UDP-N-acetylmuramoyl-L-alanyl-D-glutamate--2,6-diaminopimelate ligase